MPDKEEWSEFITTGTQYYVAGRYAVIAGLMPVAGNLLHHAIEMCLKGALSKKAGKSLQQLRDLHHKLGPIWAEFKSQVRDPSLNQFDEVVADIDRFEDIRYPDRVLKQGALISIGTGKKPSTPMQITSSSPLPPSYVLWLGEVDHLIAKVLATASINPKFFTSSFMKPAARQYLTDQNDETTLT
jgi:hypothetical protein